LVRCRRRQAGNELEIDKPGKSGELEPIGATFAPDTARRRFNKHQHTGSLEPGNVVINLPARQARIADKTQNRRPTMRADVIMFKKSQQENFF
jgi:hypothetical protein